MMDRNKVLRIITFLAVFGYSWCYDIPFKRPCHDMSPECLKATLQLAIPVFANGSPELGLESLDPYILHQLNLTLSGITIHLSRGYAKGLKTCVVDFARLVDDTLETQVHCNLTIRGKYRSSGLLFMFPIDGDGISTIKCDNLKLHSILKMGIKTKDGRKYLDIKSSVIKHAYDGRVSYAMSNLFKNNAEMSKAVLNFMNSNWRLVAEEFGTPIVEFGIQSIMKNIRRLLDVVPLDVLEKL